LQADVASPYLCNAITLLRTHHRDGEAGSGPGPGRTNFSIRALGEVVEFMTFLVAITDADGGATASSHIDSLMTKQDKLLMLIPLGPKSMIAYKTYRLFTENIRAAIAAADTSSRTVLTEKTTI
jgi:hypothetical protein